MLDPQRRMPLPRRINLRAYARKFVFLTPRLGTPGGVLGERAIGPYRDPFGVHQRAIRPSGDPFRIIWERLFCILGGSKNMKKIDRKNPSKLTFPLGNLFF